MHGLEGYGIGNTYPASGDYWQDYLSATTGQALDILGARVTGGQYYSPNDPRFGTATVSLPVANYDPYRQGTGPAQAPVLIQPTGFQIDWKLAALGALLAGAFLFGRRGR